MKNSMQILIATPLALAGALLANPASAQGDPVPAPDYVGLTSGGSINASDTIPSSGFHDTSTSQFARIVIGSG